jgi:DNA-binding response OmpR family regulator
MVEKVAMASRHPTGSSGIVTEAPDVPLHVYRAQSPADAFRALSTEDWDALALDLHAWSFQGLISVRKIRAEYPTMPLIALAYPAVKDVEKRAVEAEACIRSVGDPN